MSVFKRFSGKKITAKDKNWNRGTWYIWKRVNGRVIHKALKDAQTKSDAEKAERKIIQDAFNRRYDTSPAVSFVEFGNGAYTRYFTAINANIGAKRLYVAKLCKQFKGKTLDAITPQDCRDAQTRFRKETSASSVNRIMSTLSKMFTLACQEGLLDRNPMQYVKTLKEPPPRKRLLTDAEKKDLWTELEKDSLLKRLVGLAVNLPLRRGQLLAITPGAIDLPNGLLFASSSKGRDARVIPLNTNAKNILRQMIADEQLPFPLKDFRKRWHRALIAAGINEPGGKRGENFTFHDLRKEFATNLIRNNVNPNIVQKLFAHSDMSITNVYMDADSEMLFEAVKSLDDKVQETEGVQ